MDDQGDRQEPVATRKLCSPRQRSERADRQRLIELFKQRNPIPLWRWSLTRSSDWPITTLMPGGTPPSQRLLDMGISLQLLGFPANMMDTALANYDQIVDAFSHCFYPGLFASLNIPDPYAAWPYQETYWDDLFTFVNPGGFVVQVNNSDGSLCLGADGDVVEETGAPPVMQIYDCTSADDIFHEIGHVVMDYGILGHYSPLYYQYSTGRQAKGQPPAVIDSAAQVRKLFGTSDPGTDIDGVRFGHVSDYALTNAQEDFAETFKYYVYYPEDANARVARQLAQRSTLLGDKLDLISSLFQGMTFRSGGVVDNWPGYPL